MKAAIGAGIAMWAVAAGAALGQQGGTTPSALVPVAASTLAAEPEAYRGAYVSLVGVVEATLSRTIFSVDQSRTASGPEVVIVAPTLTGTVAANTYVTVLGEVIRFEAEDIAKRAGGYSLDLSPEAIAKYRGRPAVLATAVIDAAMVDLARRAPPPMSADEQAFASVMKRVGPAFNTLRQAVTDSSGAAATAQAAILQEAFGEVEAFWKARKRTDAIKWAQDARGQADRIAKTAASGQWDEVKADTASLGQACQGCHGVYRERLEDGTFRIKDVK